MNSPILPAVRTVATALVLAAAAIPARAQAPSSLLSTGAGLVSPRARTLETGLVRRNARPAPRAAADAPMMVPVEGVRREQLHDTYTQSRSQGRTHHAIDIHAPRGTPVLAVAEGTIRKLHLSSLGGITIYLMDDDGRTRYYYAHLDSYAEGLHEGQRVQAGEVIGYVGDTGNAQPGDCHLHFSVAILRDHSRWWDGENLNPYDLLNPSGR
jgi:murein DD-endopeptidase MepM/ murein hydrolase activator NlpD